MLTELKINPRHLLASKSTKAFVSAWIISTLRELTGGFCMETIAHPVKNYNF